MTDKLRCICIAYPTIIVQIAAAYSVPCLVFRRRSDVHLELLFTSGISNTA
jgi:hypothetical protein